MIADPEETVVWDCFRLREYWKNMDLKGSGVSGWYFFGVDKLPVNA